MAYTFDNINNLLNQNQNQNQNIFGGGGNQDQGQQQNAGGQGASGGTKTSTEGEIGTGSSSSTGGQTQQPKTATNQSSGQAILQKNQNVNADFSKGLGQNIRQSQQNLENEANQYTQNQQGKAVSHAWGDELNQAIGGNQTAYNRVNNILYGPGEQADKFTSGISSKYNDVDQLASQGGLQNYLQKRGNENYNQGEAALDSLLLSRNKDYKANIADARTQRGLLQQRQNELEGSNGAQSQAQAYLDKARADARSQALQDLTGYENQSQAALQQAAAAQNAQRAAERAKKGEVSKQQLQNTLNELRKEYAGAKNAGGDTFADSDFLWNNYTKDAGINPEDYFKVNNADYNWQNVGGDQATRFNAIANLLGQGGNRAGQQQNLGAAYTYDTDALRQSLRNVINQRSNAGPTVDVVSGGPGGDNSSHSILPGIPSKAPDHVPGTEAEDYDPRNW